MSYAEKGEYKGTWKIEGNVIILKCEKLIKKIHYGGSWGGIKENISSVDKDLRFCLIT